MTLKSLGSGDNVNRSTEAARHRPSRPEKDLGKAFGIRKNETVQTGDSGNPSDSLRSLCSFDVKKHKQERVRESCTIELSNVGRCSVIKTQTEKTVT